MPRTILLLLYDIALVCIALEDFKYRKIRNRYVIWILFLTLAGIFWIPEITIQSRIVGMFAVSIPMTMLSWLRPGSFGGGDVKLVFASGAFLGNVLVIRGTVIGIFLAGIYSIYLLCKKKRCEHQIFPLGPFLSAGYLIFSFSLG